MKIFWAILRDLYAALWRNTAGRPWTYSMREATREYPIQATIIILITITLVFISMWFFHQWYAILLEAFYWFLLGHLFWDSAGAYIKPRRYFTKEKPH